MAEKPPAKPPAQATGKAQAPAKAPDAAKGEGQAAAKDAKPAAKGPAKGKGKAKGNGNGKKRKGLGKGFWIGIFLVFVAPALGLLGWYAYQVLGHVAKESQEALDKHAQELAKQTAAFANRAAREGFRVQDFDACAKIREQYKIPAGVVYTEFTQRQLVGLSKFASDEQVKERCVQFAKAVAKMQQMSHHTRHVYICQTAQFAVDKAGNYFLTADPQGRGVVENFGSNAKLTPIGKDQSILLRGWQIFNQGDGCLIIGMSKTGIFTFSGGVKMKEGQ